MENEKKFNLRKLETRDIFPLATILTKVGVKQLIKAFNDNGYLEQLNNKDVDKNALYLSMAFTIGGLVLENLESCELPLYKFLSNLSGLEPQAIGKLPPAETIDLIYEVIHKEEFKDFFKAASRFAR